VIIDLRPSNISGLAEVSCNCVIQIVYMLNFNRRRRGQVFLICACQCAKMSRPNLCNIRKQKKIELCKKKEIKKNKKFTHCCQLGGCALLTVANSWVIALARIGCCPGGTNGDGQSSAPRFYLTINHISLTPSNCMIPRQPARVWLRTKLSRAHSVCVCVGWGKKNLPAFSSHQIQGAWREENGLWCLVGVNTICKFDDNAI
jgi:hypothetical protein